MKKILISSVILTTIVTVIAQIPKVVSAPDLSAPNPQPIYKVTWKLCAQPDVLAAIKVPKNLVEVQTPLNGCYASGGQMIVWGAKNKTDSYIPKAVLVRTTPPFRKDPVEYKIALYSFGCYPQSSQPQDPDYLITSWPALLIDQKVAGDNKTLNLIQVKAEKITLEEGMNIGFGLTKVAQSCSKVKNP